MTFGKYPDVFLARARERHALQRSILAEGLDPMARKKAEKTAVRFATENVFATVAGKWLEHWKDDKSPRHVDSTQRRLASDMLPTLGALQMDEIQAPDIVNVVRTIETRGARDVAKRALETTGQIFRFAIAHGYAKRNPAKEIEPRDILNASVCPTDREVVKVGIQHRQSGLLLREPAAVAGSGILDFSLLTQDRIYSVHYLPSWDSHAAQNRNTSVVRSRSSANLA